MPKTRAARRDAETVRSAPGRAGYHCPDLPTLDGHLARLADGLRGDSLTPSGQDRIRDDINALLDRRAWLTMKA